jgi:hypothetical protein
MTLKQRVEELEKRVAQLELCQSGGTNSQLKEVPAEPPREDSVRSEWDESNANEFFGRGSEE